MLKNSIIKLVKPGAFSFLSVLVLSAMLFSTYFFTKRFEINTNYDTFLFQWLIELLSLYPAITFILSFILTIIIAFLLFKSNEQYSFIRVRTVLPSLFFIFFMIVSGLKIEHSQGLLGSLFLLIFIWIFLSVYRKNNPTENIFNAFFYLSIGSFFSFELLLIAPFLYLLLFLFRVGSIRTLLAAIIGFITPYILYLSVLFLAGSLEEFLSSMQQQFESIVYFTTVSTKHIIAFGLMIFLFLITFIGFFADINSENVKSRHMMFFFFLSSLFLIIISGLKYPSFPNKFPMIAMMLSILLGHYFSLRDKGFPFIMFVLIVISAVGFYFW